MPDKVSSTEERASAEKAPSAPPTGSPESGVVKPEGEIEQARANVQIAMSILEQSLPILGGDSEEGRAVHSSLGSLYKKFAGKKSQDLVPAELMNIVSGMPDMYKDKMMKEPPAPGQNAGAGAPPPGFEQMMQGGGIMNGPHIPANINP